MKSKALKKAQTKYEQSGVIVRKLVKLHTKHDADILEHLEKVDNFNGYVKELIRNQIKERD